MGKTVIINGRTCDVMAHLEDNPGVWGSGDNRAEAIGQMVNAHPEIFDIEIVDPKADQCHGKMTINSKHLKGGKKAVYMPHVHHIFST